MKNLGTTFILIITITLLMFGSLYAQDSGWVASSNEGTSNPEDDIKPAGTDKLDDSKDSSPVTSFVLDEMLNANGSFWHPTEYSHFAATAGIGIYNTDYFSGFSFDITAMFEYSLRDMTNMPLSVFGQTGLGLTSISASSSELEPLTDMDASASSTNFGLRALWLGAKYRMFDGEQIPNVFLSFLGMFGFGFGTDAGDGMFTGHKFLNPGDFSLIFGATGNYLLDANMGFHGSFFFDLLFWSYGHGSFSNSGTEFGVTITLEFFYQATVYGFHAGLDIWFCGRAMYAQRYWMYGKAMHESGLYGQLSIPLEGGGFIFAILVGYEIPLGSRTKS